MNDLCTVDQVLTELGLAKDGIDAVSRARILKLIKGVSQAVRNYTDHPFALASYTEYFDGNTPAFNLTQKPVTQVVQVADVFESPMTVQDPSLWRADLQGGFVFQRDAMTLALRGRPGPRWLPGRQRWRVDYTAGSDVIPDDVNLAAVRWIVALRNITPGMASERIGDYSYAVSAGGIMSLMPLETREILDAGYKGKRIRVG